MTQQYSIPGHLFQKHKRIHSQDDICTPMFITALFMSLENRLGNIKRQMDKELVAYLYNCRGILLSGEMK